MDRPRIFVSAVTKELATARRAVAATLRTLGYEPVSEDDFSTGYGELRRWLCQQIDESEGLIPRAPRRSGRRVYDPSVLDRLALIDLAKSAGFTVAEFNKLREANVDYIQGYQVGKPVPIESLIEDHPLLAENERAG